MLYFPASRAERFIAVGRTVLAATSLFAVWIDPTEPTNHRTVAYSLMWAYVVYSALLAGAVWRSRDPGGRARLVTHVVDLTFFSLFAYFTEGPTSPTTIYFVFSMVCATLRWRLQGVVWTAVAAIAAHVVIAVAVTGVPIGAHLETFRIVGRVVYLAVVAALLGYLGAHEERTRAEISALATWPAADAPAMEPAMRGLLEHAASVLQAPRLLLTWTEREEPWQYVADWRDDRLEWSRAAPPATPHGVATELAESDFLKADDGDKSPALVLTATGFSRWSGQALREPLNPRIGDGPLLCVRLRSRSLEGRLVVLGKQDATADDLVLGGAVAALLAARLESICLARDLAEAAATEQRIRLARDLHDGVLQSLTGIALRLEEMRRALQDRPSSTAASIVRVEELQELMALEQRDLRFFIHELEPSRRTETGQVVPLQTQLGELAHRLELEWGLAVRLDLRNDLDVPERLAREVYHITREAMVNAVRHGKASAVSAEVRGEAGHVSIVVTDNGRGFPFEGRLSHEELRRGDVGPRTLRARVMALSGTLALESTRAGARLEVLLPTEAPA